MHHSDTISWYQSVAFAGWLNHRMQGRELKHPSGRVLRIGDNAEIRLPTEWEWQWAAQGGAEGRKYPWPGGWQEGHANTSEAGLNRTTAVGMYPHGAARCGALDMAGNLYEWCLNNHSNPEVVDGYSDGNIKVLRGGSFSFVQYSAAASSRSRSYPNFGDNNSGFRVVVGSAPIISGI